MWKSFSGWEKWNLNFIRKEKIYQKHVVNIRLMIRDEYDRSFLLQEFNAFDYFLTSFVYDHFLKENFEELMHEVSSKFLCHCWILAEHLPAYSIWFTLSYLPNQIHSLCCLISPRKTRILILNIVFNSIMDSWTWQNRLLHIPKWFNF